MRCSAPNNPVASSSSNHLRHTCSSVSSPPTLFWSLYLQPLPTDEVDNDTGKRFSCVNSVYVTYFIVYMYVFGIL
ncbi:hypothetical protein EON63_13430 [archaeon]|nr:MAG: hypothetical protein EON63_13430 [archaeon]